MAAASQIDFAPWPRVSNPRDPEFELLVACCGFANTPLADECAESIDSARVLALAEHHRLLPALAERIGARCSPVRERARLHAWRAMRLTAELKRIAGYLQQCGVEFLAHKGPALGMLLYRDPALRQFGDLDLLVRAKDVQRARKALNDLGYEPELRLASQQERAYLRSGYEYGFALGTERHLLELQWQIVPRFFAIDFEMEAIFGRAKEIEIDDVSMRIPGHEDLMLALCVHAAKHEWCQLAMLRDIATLAKRDLDWSWVEKEAGRLGILNILQVSLAAAEKLFGIELIGLQPFSSSGRAFDITNKVLAALRHNFEPDTESLSYFRGQLRLRERRRDRARFIWRLAITPGPEEWRTAKLPEKAFGLYRAVRMARLIRRFALAFSS